jgi:hypothetical protein
MFAQSEFKLFQASEITKDSLGTTIKTKKDETFFTNVSKRKLLFL